ncbi:substrate-binding periplasmic protein [Thalassomonas haliotis]|uniref:Transporter substrate-binding domain-containing protein n=1 Tax=Thalassomonas haliotis TaxID=485448 RepID=A0ABY7V7V6_9GAMM|nr:transporter substrate-binding domain-containing protein [Thalassomonas haliotis]WDE09719.1 transporter substrate-binding domain-containing protein [Thalassomonas haliotis]
MLKKLYPVFYLLIGAIATAKGFAQEIIRIASGEFPPYYSERYPDHGETLNLVTQAFAQMNIKVEYGFFPWSRSYQLAKETDWDASCCWSRMPEREKDFHYSDVVRLTRVVFFHLKSYPFDWSVYEDLTGTRIGTTIRYSYGKALDAASRSGTLQIEQAPSDEINFRKLINGRIQVFPIDRDAGYQVLSDKFAPEQVQLVTHHDKKLVLYRSSLVVSRKNKHSQYILDIFHQGLKRLRASGKYVQHFAEIDKAKDTFDK